MVDTAVAADSNHADPRRACLATPDDAMRSNSAIPRMNLESLRFWYLRRVVATMLGAIGLRRSRRLAEALGRGVHDLATPGRRYAHERLQRAAGPGLSDAQRDAIIRSTYEHIGRFWVETLFLRRRFCASNWRRWVRVTDAADWLCRPDRSRGAVLATCYYGNPAVAAAALGQLLRPVHVLVDLIDSSPGGAWQRELYRVPYVRLIRVQEASQRLPDALSSGASVMLMVEHRRPRGVGVERTFLGEPGPYHATAGRLQQWFDVPIVPALCHRRGGDFEFELWLGTPVRDADAIRATAAAMQQLEAQVMMRPQQYLWNVSPMGTVEPEITGTGTGSVESPRTR